MNERFKQWTDDEVKFLVKNIFVLSDDELSDKLERSKEAIRIKLRRLTSSGKIAEFQRRYTPYEDDYIMNNYGNIHIDELCASIYRPKSSVYDRVRKLIGDSNINSLNGDYTSKELSYIMGVSSNKIITLAKNTDMPHRKVGKFNLYDQDDFWNWIKVNENYINATNIDYDDLFHCPEWYRDLVNKLKREVFNGYKKGKMSKQEMLTINNLKRLGYQYKDIALEINRPIYAINNYFAKLKKLNRIV